MGELRNYRLITMELSGHGESGRRRAYSAETWGREAAEVIGHFGGGTLVGHSMGGLVAVVTASCHPDSVNGVVLVDSKFRWPKSDVAGKMRGSPQRPLRLYPTQEAAIAAFRLLPAQPIVNPAAFRYIAERSPVEVDGAWQWRFDPRIAQHFSDAILEKYTSALTCPLEFICGAKSSLVDGPSVMALESMLGHAVHPEVIPDAYHHVILDQPRLAAVAIREALERIAAATLQSTAIPRSISTA
jgi:pimeloyl-ACP methyl ester carboxylesterase